MNTYLNFSFSPDSCQKNAPYFRQVCDHFPELNLKKNRKSLQAPLVLLWNTGEKK